MFFPIIGWAIINLPELMRSFVLNLKSSLRMGRYLNKETDPGVGRYSKKNQCGNKKDMISPNECSCMKLYLNSRIQVNRDLLKMKQINSSNSRKCELLKYVLTKELSMLENIQK